MNGARRGFTRLAQWYRHLVVLMQPQIAGARAFAIRAAERCFRWKAAAVAAPELRRSAAIAAVLVAVLLARGLAPLPPPARSPAFHDAVSSALVFSSALPEVRGTDPVADAAPPDPCIDATPPSAPSGDPTTSSCSPSQDSLELAEPASEEAEGAPSAAESATESATQSAAESVDAQPSTQFTVVHTEAAPASTQPPASSARPVEPTPPPGAGTIDRTFAATVLQAVNGVRLENGLAPLTSNDSLRVAAENYARLLVAADTLDHHRDGEPWDRAGREGYTSGLVGEVLGLYAASGRVNGTEYALLIVDAWMHSPGHRDIILGKDFDFSEAGVGCAVGLDTEGRSLVICDLLAGVL